MININITCEGEKVGVSATEQSASGVELHVHVVADNITDAVVALLNRFVTAREEVMERLKTFGIVTLPDEAKPEDMPS